MKKYFLFGCLSLTSLLLTGCSAVETIFKAGMWWAFILVFLGIGLIFWIFSKMRSKD
ncbi:phosphatidate cytidylyltransferase [Paenimyroides viscosum]|uniref:phosphatidate cytidylyltransferase n=1 Tax=Paenimyroides viscosum TaxID=2488729 RepID=UPI001939F3DE|nr:phosphatidate cytidylyltransferase [Paenimyroides viscosum]